MELDQNGRAPLAYLVHDLSDAAVHRRINLFAREGFVVGLAGFRRHAAAPETSMPQVLDLGRTMDARLAQRARSVVKYLMAPGVVRDLCRGAPVIVARNLEMLALAWRVRGRHQRLVYECLDIHRMMLGDGRKSRLMRWLERRLLARTDLVIVSSPAFTREYFTKRQGRQDRILLVENKVPGEREMPLVAARPTRGHAAWTIGWFGMLRCQKTLRQLAALARSSDGRIDVVIAGIPSPAEFPDFSSQVADCPGLRYLGPFRQEDLPLLYEAVDFVWAIDYFEEGLNSDWLLPNRLYEGLASGAVPIALKQVETGRWLQSHGVGLLVRDALAELPGRLGALGRGEHIRMREAIARLPEQALYQTPAERHEIAAAVAGYACV
jgi:succinoglycan biosynthesis protein ExoL